MFVMEHKLKIKLKRLSGIKSWGRLFGGAVFLLFAILSCEKENRENGQESEPLIEFYQPEYTVKTGDEITLAAKVENAVDPVFSWELNSTVISTTLECVFRGDRAGEYFVNFRVETAGGSAEKQLKVTVLDRVLPKIDVDSIVIAFSGVDKEIRANVLYTGNIVYEWYCDGKIISETNSCIINSTVSGEQLLTVKAIAEDGFDIKQIRLRIFPKPSPEMFFDDGHFRTESDRNRPVRMSVPIGKSLVVAPVICNFRSEEAQFQWSMDGVPQASTGGFFTFTPAAKGIFRLEVRATVDSRECAAEVNIECLEPEETYFRAAKAGRRAKAVNAFAYIPAPGQFINYQEGSAVENARAEFQKLLDGGGSSWISLGSFGGYCIAGFDHSVRNVEGKPDIRISGNAFAGSSEPGIVWVMQDENGNGLPDDTWYELAGSDSKTPETGRRYAVTYYRPDRSSQSIQWTDNLLNTGTVAVNAYHTQQSYFPMFIGENYTLCGTCLKSNVEYTDMYRLKDFAWGYVDNFGDGSRPNNEFWIEDAMQADGSPANLKYVDFVKVHTGMNVTAGYLGEISCEAGVPADMNF